MGSRFSRHSFGTTALSSHLRGARFVSPRTSSLLVGATLAAGALLVAPHTPRVWAAPTVGGDENGPKVQIVSPAYQDVLRGRARILVAVKVTQYNPSTIQLFLDDKPASNVLPLSSFASSTFDWDTKLTADGPHKLSVRVTDTQGFRGWAEVNVYVNNQNVKDTVAPDLNWGNIEQYQTISGQAQIQLQAKDNFGVKWIIVSLNPLAQATKQPAQRSWLLSKPPYNFTFDSTKVADGLYALSARAWDSMEQEGQSQTLTIGVVNSPVNATTVEGSIEAMRARDAAQKPKTPPTKTQTPPPTKYVDPVKVPAPDAHSGNQKPQQPANTGVKPPVVAPQGRPTPPTPVVPPVEVASNDAAVETAPPALSTPSTPSRLEGAVSTATTDTETTATTGNGTLLARSSEPTAETRVATPSAALSEKGTSNDVLAPALSGAAQPEEVTGNDSVRVARLDTPEMAPRAETEATSATLSTRAMTTTDAVAPARGVDGSTAPMTQERVEVARLSAPEGDARTLEVAPVLSSNHTTLSGAVSSPQNVAAPAPAKTQAPELVSSWPVASRGASKQSKVVQRPPYQRNPHVVNKIDKTAPAKTTGTTIAQAPEQPELTAPQLSQPKPQNNGVVATPNTTPSVKVPVQVAALPKTGTPDGNPVAVAPSTTLVNPVITVSPVQVAFDKSLPAYYQARHTTTIRAVAEHYGLPVELVATANNWTTDMKILPGMKVQLPRQVQVSYNGQKLRGDVASLMAGDTTFTAMRFLFEHTGGTIKWDAAKQEVVAKKGESTIRVKIGSKTATVNNKEVMMQLAAFLFEGRTMVPARFFEEGLNAQVEWNPQTGRMVVAMAG